MGAGKRPVIVGAAGSALLFMSGAGQVLERVEGAHRGAITSLELCPTLHPEAGAQTALVASASSSQDRSVRLWHLPQD